MFGLTIIVTIGISAIIAKALDRSTDYKSPKGKYRKRYK